MKRPVIRFGSVMVLGLLGVAPALAAQCPPDSVRVGAACVGKYEASVWSIPATNPGLITKVKRGIATLAALQAGGAIQRGLGATDDYPCNDDGNDCTDVIYAVSIPGVKPSANITWFQAQQACENVGQRLLRNGEWQQAAAGTPDPGTDNGSTDCNITNQRFANDPVNTGSRANCVSNRGVFDMVGNVWEWVEDWVPLSTVCVDELFSVTGDLNCLAGASTSAGPGALIRGGNFTHGAGSGVFAVGGSFQLSLASVDVGFRCGR